MLVTAPSVPVVSTAKVWVLPSVHIGEGGSKIDRRAVLGAAPGDRRRHRGVILPGDGDGRRRRDGAAIAVVDRVGEGVGRGFARGQVIKGAVGSGS